MTTSDPLAARAMNEIIATIVSRGGSLRALDPADTSTLIASIADAYVIDKRATWWWSSLRAPTRVLDYGAADGLDRLTEILNRQPGPVIIMLTMDQSPPWPAVEGNFPDVLALLRELPICEFLVTDRTLQWLVFDTHHNSLVVGGALAGSTM